MSGRRFSGPCGLLLPSLLALAPRESAAATFIPHFSVNPGVKIAYTFGEGGGLTLGGELSMVAAVEDPGAIVGVGGVLDLTWTWGGRFQVRLGGEVVSYFVGIEAGPGLVFDERGTHFSLSLTPWVAVGWWAFVIPYYTYSFVFGAPNMHELGTYGKLAICTSSDCKSHHSPDTDLD